MRPADELTEGTFLLNPSMGLRDYNVSLRSPESWLHLPRQTTGQVQKERIQQFRGCNSYWDHTEFSSDPSFELFDVVFQTCLQWPRLLSSEFDFRFESL